MNDKPDIVTLHIGSNSINHRDVKDIDINTTGDGIINIYKKFSTSGVKDVVISSICLNQ